MKRFSIAVLLLSLAAVVGCTRVSPTPAPQHLAQDGVQPVRMSSSKAAGSACGIEIFDLLPIGTWNRTQRAYDHALVNANAKALLGPTVSDSRFDLMVATVKCAAVEGTAVY